MKTPRDRDQPEDRPQAGARGASAPNPDTGPGASSPSPLRPGSVRPDTASRSEQGLAGQTRAALGGTVGPRGAPGPAYTALAAGQVVDGKYLIEGLIARGGMGSVYRAQQVPLRRPVALKVLIPQRFDREFRRRFLLEASTCARLSHRHIVTIHDYGETPSGDLFMAMEYLDGVSLSKAISHEVRFDGPRACRIAMQIAGGLRAAHRAGVVHRDLKPSNVMLLEDEDGDASRELVKVLDFGLVKLFETEKEAHHLEELTRAGTMLGSPRYMAPEQIRCQPVDPRTDIYSFGAILFCMLTGRPPFVGSSAVEILNHHLKSSVPEFASVLPETSFSPQLEGIVRRCLEKQPARRYPSMDAVLSDVREVFRRLTEHNPELRPGSDLSNSQSHSDQAIPRRASSTSGPPPEFLSAAPKHMVFREGEPPSSSQSLSLRPNRRRGLAIVGLGIAIAVATAALVDFRSPRPTVQVQIQSEPQGASVEVDGRRLGQTPMTVALPRTDKPERFRLKLDGYHPAEVERSLDRDLVEVRKTLRAQSRPKPQSTERIEPQEGRASTDSGNTDETVRGKSKPTEVDIQSAPAPQANPPASERTRPRRLKASRRRPASRAKQPSRAKATVSIPETEQAEVPPLEKAPPSLLVDDGEPIVPIVD